MRRAYASMKAFYSNLRIKYKLFVLISTAMLIMCLCCLSVLQFEIAESLGYGDNPQYFSKVFKKYTGFTPSEFKSS